MGFLYIEGLLYFYSLLQKNKYLPNFQVTQLVASHKGLISSDWMNNI